MDKDTDDAANQALERHARAGLRRLVAEVSPEIRQRLEESAIRAAREARHPTRAHAWRVAVPVGGGLAAAVLAVVLFRSPTAPPVKAPASSPDDLALLLNVDNLDLLEQMEFYQWLDREPGLLESAAAKAADAQRS